MADNSFAFPQRWSRDTAAFTDEDHGMTLRDWFAGQSISASMSLLKDIAKLKLLPESDCSEDLVAKAAYDIADAMLRARAAFQSKEAV